MCKKIYLCRLFRKPGSTTLDHNLLINLGEFGIISREPGLLTIEQQESIRKLLSRRLKPINGRYWLHITYYIPLTKKSKGSRMGKGKGAFLCNKAPIKEGHLLCEFSGVEKKIARELHKSLSKKLPIKTAIITNAFS
jgi:large subunit ribosomal protein L16